jgi:hypothetical protein
MALKIENKFSMFQLVYLISDSDQHKRQVVHIILNPGKSLSYILSCNGESSEHYEEEITAERQVM